MTEAQHAEGDQFEGLKSQFNTFSASQQARILRKVQEEIFTSQVLALENPGAFLAQVEKPLRKTKAKKRSRGGEAADEAGAVDEKIGGGIVDEKRDPVTPVKRAKPHCSICEEEGHTKKTCAKNPDKKEPKEKTTSPTLSMEARLQRLKQFMK
jgi:hypothetical protein